jgi:hypothetical protein
VPVKYRSYIAHVSEILVVRRYVIEEELQHPPDSLGSQEELPDLRAQLHHPRHYLQVLCAVRGELLSCVEVMQHDKGEVAYLSRVQSGVLYVCPVIQESILFIRVEFKERAVYET